MLKKPGAVGLTDPSILRKTEGQLAQASIIANGKQTVSDSEVIKPYTTVSATNDSATITTNTTTNIAGDTTTIYTAPGSVYVSSIDQTIRNITNNVTNVDGAGLDTVNVFTKNQSVSVVTLESVAGLVTMDTSLSNNFRLWLTEDTTLETPTNATDGMVVNFQVRQGSAGNWTLTFPGNFSWPGGVIPVITTDQNAYDFISMFYDGLVGAWRCVCSQNFGVPV